MTTREYLLLRAPLFALGIAYTILGTLFTIFPDLLNHSPVAFENRGPIHHLWHYTILIGGFALAIGIYIRNVRVEVMGLWGVGLAVLLNFMALVFEEVSGSDSDALSGVTGATRLAVLAAIAARLYVVLRVNPQIERDLHGP